MQQITSADNAEIKAVARLHARRGREEAGLMLLEGPHLLDEALRAGVPPERVFVLADWHPDAAGEELLRRASAAGALLAAVPAKLMAKMATTETPPPILATVAAAGPPAPESQAYGLIVDGLQDPGNLGTILRSAWGAGLGFVWATPGTVDFYATKVIRAAQGAHFHLAMLTLARAELLARIAGGGWWLAATSAQAATPFWEASFRRPCLVCIGGEARGIGQDLLAAADELVAIPLQRGVDSLNAAVSAGIILSEFTRRKALSGRET